MNKINSLFVILLLFILSSCKKEATPSQVAEKFLTAMEKHDYTEAGKYSSKETVKLLKQLKKIEEINDVKQEVSSGKITIVSEDIQGHHATVFFKVEGDDLEQKISLERVEETDVDGNNSKEWKIALRKEELHLNKGNTSSTMQEKISS